VLSGASQRQPRLARADGLAADGKRARCEFKFANEKIAEGDEPGDRSAEPAAAGAHRQLIDGKARKPGKKTRARSFRRFQFALIIRRERLGEQRLK